jgi:hypothetical protein
MARTTTPQKEPATKHKGERTELLRAIVRELEALNAGLQSTNQKLDALRTAVKGLAQKSAPPPANGAKEPTPAHAAVEWTVVRETPVPASAPTPAPSPWRAPTTPATIAERLATRVSRFATLLRGGRDPHDDALEEIRERLARVETRGPR